MQETDITHNKHKGSPESVAAYERLKSSDQLTFQRWAVLRVLAEAQNDGLTAAEAVVATGIGYTSVSARFSELKKLGLICRNAKRRPTKSGFTAAVYVLATT